MINVSRETTLKNAWFAVEAEQAYYDALAVAERYTDPRDEFSDDLRVCLYEAAEELAASWGDAVWALYADGTLWEVAA